MKVYCPKCNGTIENTNINVTENVCVCSKCNELFKLSELLDQENINETENLLRNPPKGIWISKNNEHTKIKISTHSSNAIFLIFFTLAFSGISFLGFFQTIVTKSIIGSLFMSVFAAASIYLWIQVFFSLFGKIVIVININKTIQDYIFIGVGIIGKKYHINWGKIINIYEHSYNHSEGGTEKKIYISEENKLIKIPVDYINYNKKRFLLMVLEYYRHKNKNYFLP
jgi:ABC-type multidrug transport system fused ATPase/permease subunit